MRKTKKRRIEKKEGRKERHSYISAYEVTKISALPVFLSMIVEERYYTIEGETKEQRGKQE